MPKHISRANLRSVSIPKLSQAEWQRRLTLTDDAIHAAISPPRALTHRGVQELLPAYVTAEKAGQAVEKMFPEIAEHFETCPSCRATYLEIKRAIETVGPFQPATIAQTPAPKSERVASSKLWHITSFRASRARPERVQILIPALFRLPAPALSLRSGSTEQTDAVILNDQITLDNESFFVQARRLHSDVREFEIHLELLAPPALARRVRAVLQWRRKTYTRPIVRRRAIFRALSVGAPDSALTLTLELGPHEHPRRDSAPRPKTSTSAPPRAKKVGPRRHHS